MAEHTPPPWFHRQAGMTSSMGDPYDWIADSPEHGKHRKIIVCREACDPADYAFIVKAVNAWYDADTLRARLVELDRIGCVGQETDADG